MTSPHRHSGEGRNPSALQLRPNKLMRGWVPAQGRDDATILLPEIAASGGVGDVGRESRFPTPTPRPSPHRAGGVFSTRRGGQPVPDNAERQAMSPPRVLSSGVARGPSFPLAPARADGWMVGTRPTLTMR